MNIFVIIPAYNEASVIGQTVSDVRKICSNVVVVDDGSGDETGKAAEAAGAKVSRHIINRGQGAALRTGINYALSLGADIIVTFDADGQFDAAEIEKICGPIISGEADIVLGSRFLHSSSPFSKGELEGVGNKIPFLKRMILRPAILFTRALTGLELSDTHNGFRALNRAAAEKIELRQDRMAHSSEIIHEIARLNLKYKEIPITVNYTDYSRKKGQKLTGALKILFDLIMK